MGIFGKSLKSKPKRVIDDLKDDNMKVRKRAILALGSIGKSAVEPLIEALKSMSPVELVTLGPHDALAAIGEPAVEPLIRTLKDSKSSELMRMGAGSALAKMSDQASESLIKTLREKAVEPLIEILSRGDLNPLLFSSVCTALGNIGDSRAIEPLRRAIEARTDEVKGFAMLALETIQKS